MAIRPVLPLLFALAAAPAAAASPFEGTWKTDMSKISFPTKPDEMLLAGGTYTCKTCTPAYSVPADGQFHPVAGHDYFDAAAVTVVSPLVVRIATIKGGKPSSDETMTVSADGTSMASAYHQVNVATGVPFDTRGTAIRVGAKPAGAHAVSGSWLIRKADGASESALTETIKVMGDAMTLALPTGETYTATFGGPAVLETNDPGQTMIALEKISDSHVIETDSRGGKPVQVFDMTVSPDGRTLTTKVTDTRNGQTSSFVMDRM